MRRGKEIKNKLGNEKYKGYYINQKIKLQKKLKVIIFMMEVHLYITVKLEVNLYH